MSKPATAADDIKIGKSAAPPVPRQSPPVKQRRFPWRLWLYALLMTAAAGAGGYFTWTYRGEAIAANDLKAQLEQQQKAANDARDLLEKEKAATMAAGSAKEKALKEGETKVSAAEQKTKEAEQKVEMLSKNLSATKEDLEQLRAQRAETEKRIAAIEDIRKQFASMIDTGALKVSVRRGSFVLSLPAEVLFPSGVADLSDEGRIKVHEVGFTLKKFADRRFVVVGHSDNQAPGKGSIFRDNRELSAARALTVTKFLVEAGMKPENLLAAGAGEYDPVAPNTNAKDLARNRRIEIWLMPAINELPPLPTFDKPEKGDKPADKADKPDKK